MNGRWQRSQRRHSASGE